MKLLENNRNKTIAFDQGFLILDTRKFRKIMNETPVMSR